MIQKTRNAYVLKEWMSLSLQRITAWLFYLCYHSWEIIVSAHTIALIPVRVDMSTPWAVCALIMFLAPRSMHLVVSRFSVSTGMVRSSVTNALCISKWYEQLKAYWCTQTRILRCSFSLFFCTKIVQLKYVYTLESDLYVLWSIRASAIRIVVF